MSGKRFCRPFQHGKCERGPGCAFLHERDPQVKPKACEYFMKGRCRLGDSCTYSHNQPDIDFLRRVNLVKDADVQSQRNSEALFRSVRNSIPRDGASSMPLTDHKRSLFFQQAQELVAKDIATMQETVGLLSGEGGLKRVDELLNAIIDNLNTTQLRRQLTNQLVPFFNTLAHPSVSSSLLLRPNLITFYNWLYKGDGTGERAVKMFSILAQYFTDCGVTLQHDGDHLAIVLLVLSKMLEVNTSAHANAAYNPIVETLATVVGNLQGEPSDISASMKKDLRKIQQRLGIGSSLPDFQSAPQALTDRAVFRLSHDFPGELSEEGIRHDNDHAEISKVTIMPTLQEIESSRNEYLPLADPREWHLSGPAGLVDRHFRLLREDTVGQLRDAAKIELAKFRNPYDQSQKQLQGARTYIYRDVEVCSIVLDEHTGLQIALGFQQPSHRQPLLSKDARIAWWRHTKRLLPDALICLLSFNGNAIFLTVAAERKPPSVLQKQFDLASDADRAYVVATLVNNEDAASLAGFWIEGRAPGSLSLVEFPGILLPAFVPTLKAMQRLSTEMELPFADLLAPQVPVSDTEAVVHLPAPAYATQRNFRYNLACITHDGADLYFAPGEDAQRAATRLQMASTLDPGQAQAVIYALSHALACIQGPPGTGKSYTGVALVRAQLHNKRVSKIGPIVIVTFTNHALDQVLERLHDEGVDNIIRIGSRSKSEILQDCNLREVGRRLELTKPEKSGLYTASKNIKAEVVAINQILGSVSQVGTQAAIEEYLKTHYPDQHDMLFHAQIDEDGFEVVRHNKSQTLAAWLSSGRLVQERSRPVRELYDVNLHHMSRAERAALYESWCEDHLTELLNGLEVSLEAYDKYKSALHNVRAELDLRVLRQANVIGLTTSGLARNLELLRGVHAKVLICEEAGEVVEAHMLTALLPSIEHTILIGDHQQLRPHVQNYSLSMESRNGGQYALDMSLFERLVKPTDGFTSRLHCSTLEVQRRMHPSISRLIRHTQYPNLQDGNTVAAYPEVVGMRQRLFWLHHEQLEDTTKDAAHTTSHTNQFEVNMTAALVQHITQQGVYKANEIAVITPYLGQLRAISKKLGSTFAIVMNERDVVDLEKDAPNTDELSDVSPPAIAKGNLLQALRIATVDNFQGEEAKVVIVSLVRSNAQNKPGFIKTPNRINVLLSRAQHGMYIIGNANTIESVPMWCEVTDMLKKEGNFGTALSLCCPRHPNTQITVRNPTDFVRLAPEAGCDLACESQLHCGHACVAKCHSKMLHDAVFCTKPCPRLKKGCDHLCPKPCGAECDQQCQTIIEGINQVLSCGHIKDCLRCHEYQHPETIVCRQPVERTVPGCNHIVTVPCHSDVDHAEFKCKAICSEPLACGHNCKRACHTCKSRDNDRKTVSQDHGKCSTPCGRRYANCKHSCSAVCHSGTACGLCRMPCDNRCAHAACSKVCSEACTPCMEADCCSGQECPHQDPCTMPCAAPCNWLPCSRRCEKLLACGCRCPSVCGEACPDPKYCQLCGSDDIKSLQADLIMLTPYGDIDLDDEPCIFAPCGHVFTITSLDGTIGMDQHYHIDPATADITGLMGNSEPFSSGDVVLKTCPECRASLRTVARYGRIVKRALLDESTKKIATWSNKKHEELASTLMTIQANLLDSLEQCRKPVQDVIVGGSAESILQAVSKLLTAGRYKKISTHIAIIKHFAHQVSKDELPYQRVHDMVEHVRRSSPLGSNSIEQELSSQEIQPREHLLAQNLWLRSMFVLLSDIVGLHNGTVSAKGRGIISFDLSEIREICNKLGAEASDSKSVLQEAGAMMLWARFAALECSVAGLPDGNAMGTFNAQQLNEEALERLDHVDKSCQHQADLRRSGRPTNGDVDHGADPVDSIVQECKDVRRLLKEGVSDTEMRMIVAAMSREFSGTGRWYRCINGHAFSVGQCGMPMEMARCPECGECIGGENHRAAEGTMQAQDIEQQFGRITLST